MKNALQRMQVLERNTHLAGGAVRDSLLGREIKDWDIFFPFGPKLNNNVLDGWFGANEEETQEGQKYFTGHTGVMTVRKHTVDGHVLNLIGMADKCRVLDNINRMDIGICRVALDPASWCFVYGEGFLEDATDCVLKLRAAPSLEKFDNSMRRLARLQKKFETWDIVIDGSLTHYLNPVPKDVYEHEF